MLGSKVTEKQRSAVYVSLKSKVKSDIMMKNESINQNVTPPPGARVSIAEISSRNFTHYETGVSPLGLGYTTYSKLLQSECIRKTAQNLKVPFEADLKITCRSCVYHSQMPGIYLYEDGLCNMCHAFESGLARANEAKVLQMTSDF